jgi:hypothetical protein
MAFAYLSIYTRIRATGENVKDGERLALPIKDLGSCEVYPQTLQHSPNGRFEKYKQSLLFFKAI